MKGSIDRIIKEACLLWNVSCEDVLGRKRTFPLSLVRAMIAKTIRDLLRLPFMTIGKIMNRNHSSVIHYIKIYDAEYKYNQDFRKFANVMKDVVLDIRTDFQKELEDELNEIIG